MKKQKIAVSMLVAGGLLSPLAYATNGMNLEGYGPVAAGMGGASMAYDNGTAAIMNNPATLGMMNEGSRVDIAVGGLFPKITSNMPGMAGADSSANAFYMPAMGYARKSGQLTYGLGVFSQGGMGTEYAWNSFMAAGSGEKVRSEVGVGRFIVPLAYNLNDKVTIAGSVDYVWAGMDLKMALSGQQFGDMIAAFGGSQKYGSASGSLVNTFGGAIGAAPGQLTPPSATGGPINWARVDFSNSDNFTGEAKGGGFAGKLGATFKATNSLTLGMTYHSKTAMSDLKSSGASMSMNVNVNGAPGPMTVPVSGSVAVHNFQWPMTFGFGGAYQVNDQFMLVADYKLIGWKDAMKDFSMTFTADATQADASAAAFGMGGKSVDMTLNQNWDNQNVIEIGGAYKANDALTLRGGLNLANNPVPDTYMNPLFPAIAKSHVTGGFGYAFSKASTFDMSLVLTQKVSATNGSGVTTDFGGWGSQLLYSYRY